LIREGFKNMFRKRKTQARPSVSPIYRGKHVYYPEKCTSCAMCIKYCPSNAIKFRKDKKIKIDLNRCIFCGQCEDVCPKDAIKLTNFYNMNSDDKSEIYGEEE
jgi:hydrogenase-4 component H